MSTHSLVLASLKERQLLNKSVSDKAAYHLVLDISHLDMNYKVGDCVGILPTNPHSRVEELLRLLNLSGAESVSARDGTVLPLRELLQRRVNITRISTTLLKHII